MEVLIYDSNLMRQGVIENHTSLLWTRKYHEPGTFEIHAPLTSDNVRLLSKNNIIAKNGSIEAGVIESIVYTEGYEQKDIVASGRFLSSFLDRRLIKETFTFNGKVEVAMRNLINYVTAIPNLVLGNLNNFDETVVFQATMKELLSIIVKLSKTSTIGFRIVPDFTNKQLVFETYKGVDHSTSQTENNHVIFSEKYANLDNVVYSWNNQLYKTYAIIGGEGEGAERKYVYIGGGEGLNLREVFVDAREIRSEDFSSMDEYDNALKEKGYEALANDVVAEAFDCVINPYANFKYKQDWDLGDIVTVNKVNWGIKSDLRITEVQEIFEDGGMTVVPTFGNALPDTVDWSN